MDTLSLRMKHIRDASGLRHEDLAALAGCSTALISHMVTGIRTDPAASYLDGIATALGLDLAWLVGGRGDAPDAEHLAAAGARIREKPVREGAASDTDATRAA